MTWERTCGATSAPSRSTRRTAMSGRRSSLRKTLAVVARARCRRDRRPSQPRSAERWSRPSDTRLGQRSGMTPEGCREIADGQPRFLGSAGERVAGGLPGAAVCKEPRSPHCVSSSWRRAVRRRCRPSMVLDSRHVRREPDAVAACGDFEFDRKGDRVRKRGSGSSGTGSRERRRSRNGCGDVRAVMDAVNSPCAALVGAGTDGGAMSMLFAATYPERVFALAWSRRVRA